MIPVILTALARGLGAASKGEKDRETVAVPVRDDRPEQ